VELNYRVTGEGQPIIILHGLFGMLDNWQTFGKKLSDDGYKVYLLDQRDHGRSPWSHQFDIDILSLDLREFIDQQEIDYPIIMGHSMGGKVVMRYAANYEEDVKQLVVIDMAPKAYPPGHDDIFYALSQLDLDGTNDRKDLYQALAAHLNDEVVIQFMLKNISRKGENESGFELKFNRQLLESSYDDLLLDLHFEKPVLTNSLFVRGSQSHYIKDEDWFIIKKRFPNSTLKTVEGAGHWVHAEKPDELYNFLAEFLNP
jgi:esterase